MRHVRVPVNLHNMQEIRRMRTSHHVRTTTSMSVDFRLESYLFVTHEQLYGLRGLTQLRVPSKGFL